MKRRPHSLFALSFPAPHSQQPARCPSSAGPCAAWPPTGTLSQLATGTNSRLGSAAQKQQDPWAWMAGPVSALGRLGLCTRAAATTCRRRRLPPAADPTSPRPPCAVISRNDVLRGQCWDLNKADDSRSSRGGAVRGTLKRRKLDKPTDK